MGELKPYLKGALGAIAVFVAWQAYITWARVNVMWGLLAQQAQTRPTQVVPSPAPSPSPSVKEAAK